MNRPDTPTSGGFVTQSHGADALRQHEEALLDVYREVYADRLDMPFFTPERFWERLEAYAAREGFRLVLGTVNGEVIGFTLGYTLPEQSGWWRGLRGEVAPELVHETGTRTFAINELMVRPAWRRQGYAEALSAALLADRPEERATLLVRAGNVPAYTAYRSWGFEVIGQLQPFDDAPVYEAMVRDLP